MQTEARIDLSALAENIKLVRNRIPAGIKVLFAVKADGYGHGIEAVCRAAEQGGIDYLGVATVEEGRKIRAASISLPILLLGSILPAEIGTALDLELTPFISDLDFARRVAQAAGRMGKRTSVQVNVDTGMGRFGVRVEHALDLFKQLGKLDNIEVEGVFSHLSSAEDESSTARKRSLSQIERFNALLSALDEAGLLPPLRHIGNSAGMIQFPNLVISPRLNMVRIGTLLYGYPEVERPWAGAVKPVATLLAQVISIKELLPGDCVGYDCTYRADRKQRIAIISIGYGYGLSPALSNCGNLWLHGKLSPIVGKVCLDHTIVDVTDIPEAAIGDRVEVFGPQNPADRLARMANLSVCQLLVPALRAASVRRYDS